MLVGSAPPQWHCWEGKPWQLIPLLQVPPFSPRVRSQGKHQVQMCVREQHRTHGAMCNPLPQAMGTAALG